MALWKPQHYRVAVHETPAFLITTCVVRNPWMLRYAYIACFVIFSQDMDRRDKTDYGIPNGCTSLRNACEHKFV